MSDDAIKNDINPSFGVSSNTYRKDNMFFANSGRPATFTVDYIDQGAYGDNAWTTFVLDKSEGFTSLANILQICTWRPQRMEASMAEEPVVPNVQATVPAHSAATQESERVTKAKDPKKSRSWSKRCSSQKSKTRSTT